MLPTMAQSIASALSCSQVSTCCWLWAGRHEGCGQKPVGHISGSTHMSLPWQAKRADPMACMLAMGSAHWMLVCRRLYSHFLSAHHIDAAWQRLQCSVDVGLLHHQIALCVIYVLNGVLGLQLLDAGLGAIQFGHVLNLDVGGIQRLLVPCEAASCGQESLVGVSAHQYALQGIGLLLGGYAVASLYAQAFPTASEGHLVAGRISLGHAEQLCAHGLGVGRSGAQSLQLG